MAKRGYTVHGTLNEAAGQAGKALGKGASSMQGATMDATKGADQHVDINDEGGSQLLRDGGEGAQEAGRLGEGVAKSPVKISRTIKDIRNKRRKLKNFIKKMKPKVRKFKKRAKEFLKDPKKFMNKVKRARTLRKNMRKRGRNLKKKVNSTGKNAGKATSKAADAAKKASNSAKRSADAAKATQKASEMTAKATKALIKAIRALIKGLKTAFAYAVKLVKALVAIIAQYWWVILIILVILIVIIALASLAYVFINESPSTGDLLLDTESDSQRNNVTLDSNGHVVQTDISTGNKIVTAYYTYYSTKSLWVLFDGMTYDCREGESFKSNNIDLNNLPKEQITVNGKTYDVLKPVQYGSKEFVEIYKYDPFTGSGQNTSGATLLKDKYNRESNFYLAAEAIASIDGTLHNGDFRYPEQVVKNVKYKVVIDNPNTGEYHFEMDDLADEDRRLYSNDVQDDSGNLVHLATLSTKYTQWANETNADELMGLADSKNLWLPCIDMNGNTTKYEVGVWDYGFGNILHYLKYLEAHENRGEVVEFEVLNKGVWDTTGDNGLTDAQYHKVTTSAISGGSHQFLPSQNISLYLYKQAQIETMTYAEWYALSATAKQQYFTGEGKYDDPTHPDFNKNRVYGLPSTDSYMIDWVVTPAGTLTTVIKTEWQDSGIPFVVTENDGNSDYSNSEFNGDSRFDNGADPKTTYSSEPINVQTVTHYTNGKAEFAWSQSCINSSNGALLSNPRTKVYLVRYVPTGVSAVDSNFIYSSFSENGASGYALTDTIKEINMFTKNSSTGNYECNTCGKAPAVKKYYLNDVHDSCKKQTISVAVAGSTTGETVSYTLEFSGSFKVDPTTGAITKAPKAAKPRYYENGSFVFDSTDQYGNPVKNYPLNKDNGKCRICNKKIVSVKYEAENHNPCKTVRYDYDLIKTESVAVGDSSWGLPGGCVYLTRTVAGTKWDNEPTYNGEPDTSKFTGSKYYEDYFTNYESWRPECIQTGFNFEEIMSQPEISDAALTELLKREPLSQSVATLGGIEDYFVDGVPDIDDNGTVHGYIGPGLGVVAFENGMPATEADCRKYMEEGATVKPNCTSTLSGEGFPNYGCCQMNRETLDGFYSWMQSHDYRRELWNKIFNGIAYDRSSESTAFSQAWRNSHKILTQDEYITFMLYQLAYMYKIKVADQWENIALHIPEFDNHRASQEMIFACGNNGGLVRALEYGSFGNTAVDIVNGLADVYSTQISFGAYTQTMRNKYNKYIRQYYLIMDTYNLPVFEWDEENEMFAQDDSGGGGGGGSGNGPRATWNLNRLWNKLTVKHTDASGNEYYPWDKIYYDTPIKIVEYTTSDGKVIVTTEDANSSLPREKYLSGNVTETDLEYNIAKIFATLDHVPVETYIPLTDDFFILRYQELFSSGLSKAWSGKKGMSRYFTDGWSGVFAKSPESADNSETDLGDIRYTLLNEYNATTSPILKMTLGYGGNNAANSDEQIEGAVAIHSVSKGSIIEIGHDWQYGGDYIAIQYKKAVVIYGGLEKTGTLKVGSSVDERQLLGYVPASTEFYLAMRTTINGAFIDPSPLLKGGLDEIVEFARQYLGFDYEWGGHGPTSCFNPRCCRTSDHGSYVNGTMWGFDCSGLVTYVCRSLGMKKDNGPDPWIALSAHGYSEIGQDVTANYSNGGRIDWDSVPSGTLVFFDWKHDGHIDHVGIWSGEGSLIHASGSNPYDGTSLVVKDATKNHAVHDKMVKEYFIGDVPATAVDSDFAIEHGLSTLRANAFNETYKNAAVKLVDISMYYTAD